MHRRTRCAAALLLVGAALFGALHAAAATATEPERPSLTAADRDFVVRVRLAGLWEMPAGDLAAAKGSTARVKEVGRLISDQHAKLDQITVVAARKLGITLPDEPDGAVDYENLPDLPDPAEEERRFVLLGDPRHPDQAGASQQIRQVAVALVSSRSTRSVAPTGQAFTLRVSTRNLVRDRFLGAAAGGYYLESSFLAAGGLQRGHFHTACRMLDSTNSAPNPAPVPAFFKATEDGRGGRNPVARPMDHRPRNGGGSARRLVPASAREAT